MRVAATTTTSHQDSGTTCRTSLFAEKQQYIDDHRILPNNFEFQCNKMSSKSNHAFSAVDGSRRAQDIGHHHTLTSRQQEEPQNKISPGQKNRTILTELFETIAIQRFECDDLNFTHIRTMIRIKSCWLGTLNKERSTRKHIKMTQNALQ